MDLSNLTRTAGLALFKAKQNSPTIMFVAGLAGVTTAAVLASKATLNLDKTLDVPLRHLEDIKMVEESPEVPDYGRTQATRDRMIAYSEIVFGLGKLYGPAIVIGGIGVACLTGSHNILMKRNAAITAAYVGLEKSYHAYRARIAEEIGEEKEQQLHYEVESKLARLDLPPEHSGRVAAGDRSVYGKWYNSQTTTEWKANRQDNLFFISCQERFANERLHRRGYLLLNEVYESLGLPVTDYGCVVGWVMKGDGDQYVDFGLFDRHTDNVKLYLGGINEEIFLDFNVDGMVADKVGV